MIVIGGGRLFRARKLYVNGGGRNYPIWELSLLWVSIMLFSSKARDLLLETMKALAGGRDYILSSDVDREAAKLYRAQKIGKEAMERLKTENERGHKKIAEQSEKIVQLASENQTLRRSIRIIDTTPPTNTQ